jgi:hypothetical protein
MLIGAISGRKEYKGTIMYNIKVFQYNKSSYSYHLVDYVTNKLEVLKAIKNNKLILVNASITSDNKIRVLNIFDYKPENKIRHIIECARLYMVRLYGAGTNLCGRCIEASELIVSMLNYFGYMNCKTVEGWCKFDDDSSCSDAPYDPHTWVEAENSKVYIDVTADQFNTCMYKENEYPGIIFRVGLPYGMCYDEPEGWDE